MIWLGIAALIAGALLGGGRPAWLIANRPQVSRRKAIVQSALILPILLLILLAAASVHARLTLPDQGENGYAIAILIYALFGVPTALATLLGGLAAAAAVTRARR